MDRKVWFKKNIPCYCLWFFHEKLSYNSLLLLKVFIASWMLMKMDLFIYKRNMKYCDGGKLSFYLILLLTKTTY